MKTYIPREPANQIQAEFERVAERIAEKGGQMALPMEVVLLQVPTSYLERGVLGDGSAFIVAFHTAEHVVAYIDEQDTLIEIDYLASREQAAER